MIIPSTSPIAQPVRQCAVAEKARRLSDSPAPGLDEPAHGGEQLVGALGLQLAGAADNAVAHVVVEEAERDRCRVAFWTAVICVSTSMQ